MCEAMAVLFLYQNKVPTVTECEEPDLPIDLDIATEANVPNHKSGIIGQSNIGLIRHISKTSAIKQKTLLELAHGDIDLLDDLNTSNSALENTHIEIDGFIDNAVQPVSAQTTAPREQVQSTSLSRVN
jgi:hypothetical protein